MHTLIQSQNKYKKELLKVWSKHSLSSKALQFLSSKWTKKCIEGQLSKPSSFFCQLEHHSNLGAPPSQNNASPIENEKEHKPTTGMYLLLNNAKVNDLSIPLQPCTCSTCLASIPPFELIQCQNLRPSCLPNEKAGSNKGLRVPHCIVWERLHSSTSQRRVKGPDWKITILSLQPNHDIKSTQNNGIVMQPPE